MLITIINEACAFKSDHLINSIAFVIISAVDLGMIYAALIS